MHHELSANEARVLGCLMEKSVVTPDQYPLTTNALANACNQKSARNPVMSLDAATVQRTVRELEARHFVQIDQNFKNGVEKFKQRFCNTAFNDYQFDPAEFAIVCLLLLRGPQTPGELRARSGRLHTFSDNNSVVASLAGLIEREGESLVVKLPRQPGRKDSAYMHLFSGEIDVAALASEAQAQAEVKASARVDTAELAERVSRLEAEVAQLKALLDS